MNSVIYKVIFSALKQFGNNNLSLSFANLKFEKPVSLPAKFFIRLKELSEQTDHIINFQNIEEVLIIGTPPVEYTYNYYLVILTTSKLDGKKSGFLIGNVKNQGDIILGIWPFNIHKKDLSIDKLLNLCNDIIKNPDKFNSICLISQ